MNKPSDPHKQSSSTKIHIAHSLQSIADTCATIQEEYNTKNTVIEQEIQERMSIMLQENIHTTELLRFATQCKVNTPSNHQRIGNALGLGQEQIAELREEGTGIVDMVRVYAQARNHLLHEVVASLQAIQAKYIDITQYCKLILNHKTSDHEKKSRLNDFMRLSQELVRKKQHHCKEVKALFYKRLSHQAIQKTITGLKS
ncbi:MAG: hypothetical protein WC004_00525 [Candidatus Absconditabacterales bacterium]